MTSYHGDQLLGNADSTEPQEIFDIQTALRSTSHGVDEDNAPELVKAFLANVHIKNPILDASDLTKWARFTAEHGFEWTSRSCLLLIACALGALSSPFRTISLEVYADLNLGATNSIRDTLNYSTAEGYYVCCQKKNGTSWQYSYCGSMPISVGSLLDVFIPAAPGVDFFYPSS